MFYFVFTIVVPAFPFNVSLYNSAFVIQIVLPIKKSVDNLQTFEHIRIHINEYHSKEK